MKLVGPNVSKNQNYLFRIHWTFAWNDKYSIFHQNNNLKDWKVSKILRKENCRASACLPARLLAWYWQRNFPREFAENCFVVFDQSSRIILLTCYCRLYFFPWIPRGYPLDGSVEDCWWNHRGVNIIQLRSISVSCGSMYFFLFQSFDVRASKNLSAS